MPNADFAAALNAEQNAAVAVSDGPTLVLAAAGTGKTRTLVYRVANLVLRGVAPDRILLLTFTNRAAGEMLERARALVGPAVGGIWGGTFHHLANRILRRSADRLGYGRDYTILDGDDQRTLMGECLKAGGRAQRAFPKREVVLSVLSTARNTETPLEDVVRERFAGHDVDGEGLLRVCEAYGRRKRQLGAMDFDDLLLNGLALLREHADVSARYQEQFRHILVDEYQDTNTLQAELVDRLALRHGNVMFVGDDFQSIYAWRGADFRNLMTFPQRYPGARTFVLETNYRSVPEILAVANACIAGNPEQFQKTLRPTRGGHHRPTVARVRDGAAQAAEVVAYVQRLRREGIRLSEIAVLYRAHFHAMELQMLLARERMPYAMTSGIRFFEQAHVKDVCSLLRICRNPADELAFRRVLCLMPGVGPKTAERIWRRLGRRFESADAAQRSIVKGALRPASRGLWSGLEDVLAAGSGPDAAAGRGAACVQQFVATFYEDYALNVFENAGRRMEDIREMAAQMKRYETVDGFLADVALLTNLDAEPDPPAGAPTDALRLSTVHQAKGLEWAAVIVLWMTEGMFPSPRALDRGPGAEAEERRLFYVAVTRARDELHLVCPEMRFGRHGEAVYCAPSRFLSEIPPSCFERRCAAEHGFGNAWPQDDIIRG